MQSSDLKDEGLMGETRGFERYPIEVPARVELLLSPRKSRVLFLKTCNLSATGAFFPEWQSIPVGSLVKVEYYLFFENRDDNETTHDTVVTTVTARVVRCDRFGTAVHFGADYQMRTYRCLFPDASGHNTSELPGERVRT